MFKPAGNPKVAEITKSHKERSIHLGELKVIKIELSDHKVERRCCWCAEGILRHGSQRYCTEDCSQFAMAWAYPQKEQGLGYLLQRQEWKCLLCQFDYRPILQAMVDKENSRYKGNAYDLNNLPWYMFKRLKERVAKERKPEVDHIIPISKGGTSLGLDNHQAICYTCHKSKTKIDNSGKRIK